MSTMKPYSRDPKMDLPASHYGKLDKKNPVITSFQRDINSFMTLMRRVVSSTCQDNCSYAKGIKVLLDIWESYNHRLPFKLFHEQVLRIADFLYGIRLYQPAMWHGYSLHLLQYTPVNIIEITDVDHFRTCFFPEGFDKDKDVFCMKVRAMFGSALCLFEQEKISRVLSQQGISKLLRVLDFIRIMMQAFQQHEHLCWIIYDATYYIYIISRYLMTINCSPQALEYLLWACISVELSVPLMTVKNVPWLVTLYCVVCYCYYDNNAALEAEKFARRALGKIQELSQLEEKNGGCSRESQMAFKEASIKLAALVFKRASFETRKKKHAFQSMTTKTSLKDIPNTSWPCTTTERALWLLFDCNAARFLAILEALWDNSTRPLQTKQVVLGIDEQMKEVILELLLTGMRILAGGVKAPEQDQCLVEITSSSTLLELATAGEDKISVLSAVRFIKLIFQCNQPLSFDELNREMLQVLSGLEGHPYRKAEMELTLLDKFSCLLSKEKPVKGDHNERLSFLMSDECIDLLHNMHNFVCETTQETAPDTDLVIDIVLFLWRKLKMVLHRDQLKNELSQQPEKLSSYNSLVWSLSMLTEVAFACHLADFDCILVAEMVYCLAVQVEKAADQSLSPQSAVTPETEAVNSVKTASVFEMSSAELLHMVCEMVNRGLEALTKGIGISVPQDCTPIVDIAFMQKFDPNTLVHTLAHVKKEEQDKSQEFNSSDEWEVNGDPVKGITRMFLLALDFHLELNIIHHRASLKLLRLNAVSDSDLLDRIKKNRASQALCLMQKALLLHKKPELTDSSDVHSLLEEACHLMEKAELEERKLYISTLPKTQMKNLEKAKMEEKESPPPPPILIGRTDFSLTFVPALYHLEERVCWYQLCGRVAEGINQKVRLGDCNLPGTGHLVPAKEGDCLLKVRGLEPNQKYVFAVAAYDSHGKLLGNAIGMTSFPLLASMPIPLLSIWVHLAKVSYQTGHHDITKRACNELWNHYTFSNVTHERFASTGLCLQTLLASSPLLCLQFLASIFTETEINIRNESLFCDIVSANGLFIWEQEARLAQCERMLVAMDLSMWLDDGKAAVQAAISCYSILAPMLFNQLPCDAVVQVLTKCFILLEENVTVLRLKWMGHTTVTLIQMIACLTYYMSKTLRVFKNHQMGIVMMERGRNLLQSVYDAHSLSKAAHVAALKISVHLKAIHGKNKKLLTMEGTRRSNCETPLSSPKCKDAASLYAQICSIPLKDAFRSVIKLRRRTYFVEFSALLLKRAMEEGKPDLVLRWGQSFFEYLSRRDKTMKASAIIFSEGSDETARRNTPSVGHNKSAAHILENRKKLKQKIPATMLQRVRTMRERLAVENMLASLSSIVHRQRRLLQLRTMLCEELVWRAQLNFSVAQAHLTMFFRGLEQQHGGALEYSYSTLNPLSFSLAFTGVLVQLTDISPYQQEEEVMLGKMDANKIKECSAARVEYYVNEDSSEEEESFEDEESCDEEREDGVEPEFEEPDEFALQEEESIESEDPFRIYRYTAALQWESLNSVALHFRRAMVLAHRGSNWTLLLSVCQTMWEQWCRVTTTALIASQEKPALLLSTSQLNGIFDPLVVLAADLIMDMLDKQGLWSVYDDVNEDELQCTLNFSTQLDGCTQVDMRWVRTLVLRALEQLHFAGKWESLAHFALLFNSYTRERYATVVAPLLVVAQRKLLERLKSVGGPEVPQPHHIKTQNATQKEVTYKTYAYLQLLSDWAPTFNKDPMTTKKSQMARITPDEVQLQDEEMQHALTLVSVPLSVDDTLSHFRQSLGSKPQSLQSLYHSRSLLKLLLAYTQNYFVEDINHLKMSCRSTSRCHGVDSPTISSASNGQPFSQMKEEFMTEKALYSFPIGPGHLTTVTDAFHATINHLQSDHFDSLRVLALHEIGNVEFYNGNTEAAHECWSKGVDVALHQAGVLDKWDGVSFGFGSVTQTLQQAGIWGCLQAADLTAKIAQYILISDISQRTKCCLLSAYLFKCVLCCSLAHPLADLGYASFSILGEFLPGMDLFSEHRRTHVSTTVTGLNFICQWLYATGYHITLLPLLVLYIHIVGNMCRDVQRTIDGRILKIRALTELCLFREAIKEAVELTRGTHVLLPNGHYITHEDFELESSFLPNRPLLENTEAIDELVNSNILPEVGALYGSTSCLRFELARIQLLLALSSTIRDAPRPEFTVKEKVEPDVVENSNQEPESPEPGGSLMSEAPILWSICAEKENITPSGLKFLLLEEVSVLLRPIFEKLTSDLGHETENLELALECNLLMANLHLQQGDAALSSERAVSCLRLLQGSAAELPLASIASESITQDSSLPVSVYGDSPRAVNWDEIRIALWLRCHVALVHSLEAQIPDADAQLPGMNIIKETTQVLQQGLSDCVLLGDVDNQALLMLECAELEAQRGKTDEGMAHLQRALSLLSGRTCMPPGSSLTLVQATMLLSNLSESQGDKFKELAQKLLQKQLAAFGESVLLEDGKLFFAPPGPKNVYLPFLQLMDQTDYIL
ncbi:cilia- and flagella-associated protein 54 [Synchiropus picturatus]